jgi:phosphoserine phosphatase
MGPTAGPRRRSLACARSSATMSLTAAYGDTSGDTEMLAIADEKGYRVFRGKPLH